MNFNDIYNEYYRNIFNIIHQRLNYDTNLAEELTNDVFLRFYKNFHKFDHSKKVYSLLYKITLYTIYDYFRLKKIENIQIDDSYLKIRDNKYADTDLLNNELYDKIIEAISELSLNEMNVAILYFINEYKYKDISKELDININTVKVTLNRARKKLQEKLRDFYLN